MLAQTPPMGWNSWNTFGPDIDATVVMETADAFVSTGLKAAGYEYVVIDDLWEADERVDGRLTWDAAKFPDGIQPVADYVHSKGLKFGIYSCAGSHTCAGKPASYGYEEIDARTFAEWGVDFLKYDFCYAPPGWTARRCISAWARRCGPPAGRSCSASASGVRTSRGNGARGPAGTCGAPPATSTIPGRPSWTSVSSARPGWRPMPAPAAGTTRTCWWSACTARATWRTAAAPTPSTAAISACGACWPRR